jgi:hypothetical protein
MKTLLKLIVIFAALTTVCLAKETESRILFSVSASKPTCDEVLKACDEALNKAGKVIEGKNEIIKAQEEQVKNLSEQVIDLQDERDSIFKNPIVWFLVGVAVGGLSYGLVTK